MFLAESHFLYALHSPMSRYCGKVMIFMRSHQYLRAYTGIHFVLQRVEKKDVEKMIEESKEEAAVEQPAARSEDSDQPLKDEPLADECTFDDFVKVDLRVARVLSAEDVPEARKLLKLTLGLGGDETRTVFAGIKQACNPEDLVGRLVVMAANLAPRKMKFGTSEGMILASGPGGSDVFLLGVAEGAQPGQRVH